MNVYLIFHQRKVIANKLPFPETRTFSVRVANPCGLHWMLDSIPDIAKFYETKPNHLISVYMSQNKYRNCWLIAYQFE